MAAPPSSGLQRMLQTAVQSVQWTYSLFWHLCPQQGILVWGDGYYNGAIKTRKTIQPMEVSAEEASLQRSQQLRELYESLSAGGSLGEPSGQQVRRPCAALSPEDLTESEWFYLMCVSFSFPPGVGLPGKAYAKRHHVWLTGANEVDSKFFTRAILAKSARVQTVLCIPLFDGVVEFGITEKVKEDLALVQHLKTFFNDYQKGHHLPPPKPALSEQSTSNPVNSSDHIRFHSPPLPAMYAPAQDQQEEDEDVDDEEEDDEEEDEEEEEEDEGDTGSELEANNLRAIVNIAEVAEPSELMQLEMSEDIRLGSPDEVSNNPLESDFQLLGMGSAGAVANSIDDQIRVDSFRTELARRWPLVHDQSLGRSNLIPEHDDGPPLGLELELMHEDTHYSQTVSTILNHQSNRWSDLSPSSSTVPGLNLPYSSQSSFFKWTNRSDLHHNSNSKSQFFLKYILFTIPQLHTKSNIKEDNSSSPRGGTGDISTRLRKSVSQDELSASHVMAERRRREKLNERFIILRSLVPFVTKMDKASILGDTIEYVKQLRNKIHELEADTHKSESENRSRSSGEQPQITSSNGQSQNLLIKTGSELRSSRGGVSAPVVSDKRKMRMVETSGGGVIRSKVVDSPPDPAPTPPPPQPAPGVTLQVQVSIIENDGLVELQCPYREGLLLDVMVTLRELRVDIVTVQSSLTNGIFVAKMRAKVKENGNGKKASITEVKRAINRIIPQC
ncbi:transcription factor BHLH42 [Impatiens glandulifera]|uniref:transcription factor BHLH42 n=1 Tax=Impatiens glandulifera TaxID=253017 RepID=UPI001FB155F7|nr:transcription factor BHLH42 [Impatiens glandulifera]XP_047329010.1 transcription factor BHLH42 [Impatiens glandulifera]